MTQTQSNFNHKKPFLTSQIKWCIVALIACIATCITYSVGFDSTIISFVTLTVIALTIWILELMPESIVACALPVTYIMSGVGTAPQILTPWSSSIGWLIFGGFLVGAFMMKTGLAKRIALHCIMLIGGSFIRLLLGIMLAGFILAPFIPSVLARSTVFIVICIAICESLNVKKGSREGAAIILTGFLAVSATKFAFITGGIDISMAMGLVSQVLSVPMSWVTYFSHNAIPAIIYCLISLASLVFALRPKVEGNMRDVVSTQITELGVISTKEKKALVLLAITLLLMMTDTLHGINIGWVMLLIGASAFLPIFNLLENDDLKKINYPAMFYVMGCMSIGAGAMSCGVDKLLGDAILPMIRGSEFFSIFAMMMTGTFLLFFLTTLASYATLTPTVISMAQELGISPLIMVYAYSYGLDQYLFPYEYGVLLFFYTTGYANMKHVMKFCLTRMIASIFFVLFIAYPYWNFIID